MLSLMLRRLLASRVVLIVYVVVGLLVAQSHHYFDHLSGLKSIASAVLAVVLWPLILLGISLHIK
jgi:Na+(H+)/acetate symporter ActP